MKTTKKDVEELYSLLKKKRRLQQLCSEAIPLCDDLLEVISPGHVEDTALDELRKLCIFITEEFYITEE